MRVKEVSILVKIELASSQGVEPFWKLASINLTVKKFDVEAEKSHNIIYLKRKACYLSIRIFNLRADLVHIKKLIRKSIKNSYLSKMSYKDEKILDFQGETYVLRSWTHTKLALKINIENKIIIMTM